MDQSKNKVRKLTTVVLPIIRPNNMQVLEQLRQVTITMPSGHEREVWMYLKADADILTELELVGQVMVDMAQGKFRATPVGAQVPPSITGPKEGKD